MQVKVHMILAWETVHRLIKNARQETKCYHFKSIPPLITSLVLTSVGGCNSHSVFRTNFPIAMKPRTPYFFPISCLARKFWLPALVTFRHCGSSQGRTSSKGDLSRHSWDETRGCTSRYLFFPRHWFGWQLQVTPAVTRTLLRSRISGIRSPG